MRKSLIRSVASKSISTLSPGEKLKAHNRKEANEMFLFHISQLQAKPDKEYNHIGPVEDGLVQHDPDLLSACARGLAIWSSGVAAEVEEVGANHGLLILLLCNHAC